MEKKEKQILDNPVDGLIGKRLFSNLMLTIQSKLPLFHLFLYLPIFVERLR
uniref:Uncharacterized protein n=1 Tax=Tetranychus urticae TaxID=32264 RepID=T1K2F3_TETUR